jgi:hypothetical protein
MFSFIAAMCDPRFKNLKFKHDHFLTAAVCNRAIKWFTDQFNRNYKDKVASVPPATGTASGPPPSVRHLKRRKTSAAGFFADSDGDEDGEADKEDSTRDELAEYLSLPQIKYQTEEDALQWWRVNESAFPNVAVMARQYLGCPATSASVERLFSQVGIAFSAKRKSADGATLESILFARSNLP